MGDHTERLQPDIDRSAEEVTVLVPDQPPVLTPAAARALLRLLQTAHQQRTGIPDGHSFGGDHEAGPHESGRSGTA